jgi:hypothetical protein
MLQLATLTAVVAIVAMARVSVELQPFVFYWRVISAVFIVVAVFWAVARSIRVEDHAWRYVPAVAFVLVIAVFFGVRARDDVVDETTAFGAAVINVEHLVGEVHQHGLPDHPVLIRGLGKTTSGLAQALVDHLDRDGVPVRVDTKYGYQYGTQRATNVSHVDEVWYVGSSGSQLSILDGHEGARLVGAVTPLDRADERELRQAQRSMQQQLRAAGRRDVESALDSSLFGFVIAEAQVPGISQAAADRIAALNGKVEQAGQCRCFVAAFPAKTAPRLRSSMGY